MARQDRARQEVIVDRHRTSPAPACPPEAGTPDGPRRRCRPAGDRRWPRAAAWRRRPAVGCPQDVTAGRWRGQGVIVSVVVLFMVVVGAGFACSAISSGPRRRPPVGDCFDLPADASGLVQRGRRPAPPVHPGARRRGLRRPDLSGHGLDTYPPTDAFDTFAADRCAASFQAYTGVAFDNATTLDAGYFFPLDTGWASGDRTVICYLVDAAGKPLTSSMKSPAP